MSFAKEVLKLILEDETSSSVVLFFVTITRQFFGFNEGGEKFIRTLIDEANSQATKNKYDEIGKKLITKKLLLHTLMHVLSSYTREVGELTFEDDNGEFDDNETPFLDQDNVESAKRWFNKAVLQGIPVKSLAKILIKDIFELQGTEVRASDITDEEAFYYSLKSISTEDIERLNFRYPLSQTGKEKLREITNIFYSAKTGTETDRLGVYRAERSEDIRQSNIHILGSRFETIAAGKEFPFSNLRGNTKDDINKFLNETYGIENIDFFEPVRRNGMLVLKRGGQDGIPEAFQGLTIHYNPSDVIKKMEQANKRIREQTQTIFDEEPSSQESNYSTRAELGDPEYLGDTVKIDDDVFQLVTEEEPLETEVHYPRLSAINVKLLQRSLERENQPEMPISVFPETIIPIISNVTGRLNEIDLKQIWNPLFRENGLPIDTERVGKVAAYASAVVMALPEEEKKDIIDDFVDEEEAALGLIGMSRKRGSEDEEDEDSGKRGRKNAETEEIEIGFGGKRTRKHRRKQRKNKTKKVRRVRKTHKRRGRLIKRRKSHKRS